MGSITVIGLGPGDGRLLTREAWQLLATAETLYLRTRRHPVVNDLPETVSLIAFDDIYDTTDSFAEVYTQIVHTLLAEAVENDLLYGVPGHPFMGESTVTQLVSAAAAKNIPLNIIEGLSFLEPCLTAVRQDGMDGVQIFDAIALTQSHYPPLNPDFPVLLAQVYSRLLAAELKMVLTRLYPPEHHITLIFGAGGGTVRTAEIPLYQLDHDQGVDHLTSLYIPPRRQPGSLGSLAQTVAILRSPEGCPWDQEQTAQSLRPGLMEEFSELLDAIDAADEENIVEELGDLFFHLVMQAQISAEGEGFGLVDVLAGIDAKLKRRHPHVWGDWQVADTAEVLSNWEKLKLKEKGERPSSVLDNIPRAMPALARSQKIQQKVSGIGFDWPAIEGVFAKMEEEIEELKAANGPEERSEELGDLLFVLVNIANWLDLDAESALRQANEKFNRRFRQVEQLAVARKINLKQCDLAQLEKLWQEVKDGSTF